MARAHETKDGFWKRVEGGETRPQWWTNVGGKRVCTRCRDLEAARRWRAERERALADPALAAANAETLGDAVKAFLLELKVAKRAPATSEFYAAQMRQWVRFVGKDAKLSSITPAVVQKFVAARTVAQPVEGTDEETIPVEPSTTRKNVMSLVTMLRSARHRGVFAFDPARLIPPRLGGEYVARKRKLSREQFHRLLALGGLPAHRQAWLCAAVACGGRLSEVNRLRRETIDRKRGVLELIVTKTRKTEGAVRRVPILADADWMIDRALRDGAPPKDSGLLVKPWAGSNLVRDLQAACKRAGVPVVSANDLRRSRASWLRDAGARTCDVAAFLGHASSAMVERVYAHIEGEELGALLAPAGTASVLNPPSLPPPRSDSCHPKTPGRSKVPGVLILAIGVRIPAPEQLFPVNRPRAVPNATTEVRFGTLLDEALALGVAGCG